MCEVAYIFSFRMHLAFSFILIFLEYVETVPFCLEQYIDCENIKYKTIINLVPNPIQYTNVKIVIYWQLLDFKKPKYQKHPIYNIQIPV